MLVYFHKKIYNTNMRKRILFFASLLSVITATNVMAANNFIPKKFTTVTSHDDVYPYRLNNVKQANTNKKNISSTTAGTTSAAPIGKRNVVKRNTNARSATTNNLSYSNTASYTRNVVPRSNSMAARATGNNSRTYTGRSAKNVSVRQPAVSTARTISPARTTDSEYTKTTRVSSQRCFADYKECMEMYCLREDTAYNRCYCSAKLTQIDAKYQNKIDNLIQQIIKLQYGNADTEEIREYWDETIGVYTKTNPWLNIENALNIEWPDSESRIRGQNAFNTGHEYCVRHLWACSYMATNLRDAYKSEIARDCDAYEKTLQKIQNAAESVIESYQD